MTRKLLDASRKFSDITELIPYNQKYKNRFRDSIYVEKQVTATLYYPAHEDRIQKCKILLVSEN